MWSALWVAVAVAVEPPDLDPTVATLDNGLTVVLSEDHRSDTIALHLVFGVGSRDEQEGERGCAHLFEHLMFEGSENVPGNSFDAWLTESGGENNAWTSNDATAYHMTIPSGALDLALFLESDRMGFLSAGLVQENIDNQQAVVLQERADGYAEPNGRDWDAISRLAWPVGHPYHHPVIGTVADIERFDLEAVRGFWERHYQPANATLALVGRFDTSDALQRVRHWFSDVPARAVPIPRATDPVALVAGGSHGVIEDNVEERTVYVVWETVPLRHADAPALQVLATLMSGGRGTRLDDVMYYRSRKASDVGMWFDAAERAGQMVAYATSTHRSLVRLKRAMERQVRRLAAREPRDEEVERAQTSILGDLRSDLEWPEERASVLADCQRLTGDAGCLAADWARVMAVTPADVRRVAQEYLIERTPSTLSSVPVGDDESLPGAMPVVLP